MYNIEPKIRIDFDNEKLPYRLMNTVVYTDEDVKFTIGHGFNYDGATIPRPLWSLIGSKGDLKFLKPALAHDWLCLRKAKYSTWLSTKVFYKLLIHYGTCKFKAIIMCICVYIWQILCRIFEPIIKEIKREKKCK